MFRSKEAFQYLFTEGPHVRIHLRSGSGEMEISQEGEKLDNCEKTVQERRGERADKSGPFKGLVQETSRFQKTGLTWQKILAAPCGDSAATFVSGK